MPMESKRLLASSICAFLDKCIDDGTISATNKASVDIAIGNIHEAFNSSSVEPSSIGLEQIFSVYEKTQAKTQSTASKSSSSTDADFRPFVPDVASKVEPSPEDITKAEQFKSQGNQAMSKKNYDLAINHYSSALELNPDGKVYLSNRAAAYSSAGNHDAAIADATKATQIDPAYGKAWSRLGHAYFGKGDLAGAKQAYESGIKVDPTSEIMKRGLETSTKKLQEQGGPSRSSPAQAANGGMPDLSALSSMFGGGAGGGMPDMSAITSNPAFMSMAQNLMSSGALDGLLQNPRMAEMAQRFQQGGSMPDMNEIMSDPELRNVAENFGRNFGGAGANNPNANQSGSASEDP
ncbi:Putative uncharacterized protein [Taphrina deformans PYCC 5710]|uniref:SGTA homodimerisation domain-containing protein n=1 Tax=Taphrina deformans (strain PYCC 5710 / ATCC 11124 / CBS 356.35 / IMI 108563 / JCM 9778 / NBRC 8474) TaxID=1097556 RepID=R4X7L1_TAPDE|nr:Putative uncharacterized protein [Taphrina deformans PYCC 5710]|eukprot:CCG81411.1 Putative uncharacterized protein [Taphrina deformans PYCC 5710]